jgi:DUF4097 and DUF4098 domain-containing protein YvlB
MHHFDTTGPIRLRLEFGAGDVSLDASDTTTTTVDLQPVGDDDESRAAIDQTIVEQRGDEIFVKVPRGRLLRRSPKLRLRMVLPVGSTVSAELQSADLVATGEYGTTDVSSGSGDVTVTTIAGDARVTMGSGDVALALVTGTCQLKAGSGSVRVERAGGATNVGTGSGDVVVARAAADVSVKSGSGDVRVDDAVGSVVVMSGSGNLQIGRVAAGKVSAKAASGDVQIGVAAGTAAWLDLNTISGDVVNGLEDATAPAPGEPVVEIRATTVSGDVLIRRA